MSLLMIAAVTIHDDPEAQKRYEGYVAGGVLSLGIHDAEVLASCEAPRLVEGTLPGQKIVVIRFRDQAHFDAWYNSPEYQNVLPIRKSDADTSFVLVAEELDLG